MLKGPTKTEYLIDTASSRAEPALAQTYASVTRALEPLLKHGNENFSSNVDEADSPFIAAGTPVSLLEEGEND